MIARPVHPSIQASVQHGTRCTLVATDLKAFMHASRSIEDDLRFGSRDSMRKFSFETTGLAEQKLLEFDPRGGLDREYSKSNIAPPFQRGCPTG